MNNYNTLPRRDIVTENKALSLPIYGTVEDEEHFLFHCNFHYGECRDFYNYMKNNIPNFNHLSIEQKLQTVMTKEYVQIFSKY